MGIYDAPTPRPTRTRPASSREAVRRSASSPFYQGEDTSFETSRLHAVSAFPLSGHMPAVHSWAEFNGFNSAFQDPWGNTLVLWSKGGDDPQIPDGFTRE